MAVRRTIYAEIGADITTPNYKWEDLQIDKTINMNPLVANSEIVNRFCSTMDRPEYS